MNHTGDRLRTEKYLQEYAELEARMLLTSDLPLAHTIEHYLGIPLFDESPACLDRHLAFTRSQQHCLLIVVINQPSDVTVTSDNNVACWARISQLALCWQHEHLSLWSLNATSSVLVVDRYTSGLRIPRDQGVGLARKISADLALALALRAGTLDAWACFSDADATLPGNYFTALRAALASLPTPAAAATYAFRHQPCGDAAIDTATALYEQRILAYRDGLAYAGSPYAYCALGSAMACSLRHYAAARGFPRRAAGEDFYLLNKLRKLGAVLHVSDACVTLAARQSGRTPFGTGASVNRIIAGTGDDHPSAGAIFYHPALFELLRLLTGWLDIAGKATVSDWRAALSSFIRESTTPLHDYLANQRAAQATTLLVNALSTIGFAEGLSHCQRQSRSDAQFQQHMLHWFDGFRTLRLLHEMRDADAKLAAVDATACATLKQETWVAGPTDATAIHSAAG